MTRTDQLRTRVVEEAAGLFNRYGYAVTSVDLVLRELRVRKLPAVFEDAEILAKAAFDYDLECADRVLDQATLEHDNPVDQLAGLIRGFRSLVERPSRHGVCPVFCASAHTRGAFSFVRTSTQDAVRRWRHRIRRLIREGIKLGMIAPSADPEELSSVILATLEGAAAMYLLYDDPSHLDRAEGHLAEYVGNVRK